MTSFPLPVTVYIAPGADPQAAPVDWDAFKVDITSYTREGSAVAITVGTMDGLAADDFPPVKFSFEVDNSGGHFCQWNPNGQWYGLLTDNTPAWVVVDEGGANESLRAVGLIDDLPPAWDESAEDCTVTIRCTGRTSQLLTGRHPVKSYLRAQIEGNDPFGDLVAYWSLEDTEGSGSASSPLPGVEAMRVDTGTVSFGTATPPVGAVAAPGLAAGALAGRVPDTTARSVGGGGIVTIATQKNWTWLFAAQLASTGGTAVIAEMTMAGGSIAQWDVQVTGSAVNLRYWVGSVVTTLSTLALDVLDDLWHGFRVVIWQSAPATMSAILDCDGTTDTDSIGATGARVSDVRLNPDRSATVTSMVHVALFASESIANLVSDPEDAGSGQTAQERVQAVADAFGIAVDVAGSPGESLEVGPWRAATAIEAMRSAAAADGGQLIERRTGYLGFDPHTVYENTAVALEMAGGNIRPDDFRPSDDKQYVRNKWTITREGGASATFEQTSGRRGTAAIGEYPDEATLNLASDEQAYWHAGARVRQGTVEGLRYPVIPLDLFQSPELIPDWINCYVGSRVRLVGPIHDGIPPDDVEVIIRGYNETISLMGWRADINASPWAPYQVGTLGSDTGAGDDEFVGHLDPDRISLIVAVDGDDTTMVWSSDPPSITTAAHADSFDVLLRIAGEDVLLTAATAVAAAYGATGAVDHDDNASLTPGLPAGLTAGQLLLCYAAIRNSGTGVPDTPAGWTRLGSAEGWDVLDGTNVAVFYRYALGGGADVAPTITFTGGVAGATTSAQIASLSGVSGRVLTAEAQLNASAANVSYPGTFPPCDGTAILYLAWRQDDWTSVASPGSTELGDTSSTSGSDQGIAWSVGFQTARTPVPGGSFVVTGGVPTISRGAVFVLACGVRSNTVARSQNTVIKSHAVGTVVELHDDGALQLGL